MVDSSLLPVLTRRHALLERLTAEPTRKCDLAADLSVSRSTVDRGIRELEQRDLVERDGRTYSATLAGELALEEYDRIDQRLTNIVDARELLSTLPATAPLDPVFVEDADVVVSSRPDPERPVSELKALLSSATHQRAFVPAFLDQMVPLYLEEIRNGLTCEYALTPPVLDRLLARYRDPISKGLSTGNVDLRETSADLPFCLSVTRNRRTGDATATVVVFVDEGLKGFLRNDHPDAVAWAESTLDAIWEETDSLALAEDLQHPS